MTLLDELSKPERWEEYLAYKRDGGHLTRAEQADLEAFISDRGYLPVCERLCGGGCFSVPEKKLISKMNTSRKRAVYTFPRDENYVLKLLTYLLLREYDSVFPDNLYSFRVRYGVSRAVGRLLSQPGLNHKYTYKTDVSDYFNSIDVEQMLEMLKEVLAKDPQLYEVFCRLLRDPRVSDGGQIVEERKGVMAGTPVSVFLANVYLADLDRQFPALTYARYSDDIILFADSMDQAEQGRDRILSALREKGLSVNPEKEVFTSPGERWTFLGISYLDGEIDVSPASADKLKAKIRRKGRALRRWMARKGATGEQAAKGFIRAVNRKFFRASSSSELTWTRWYFPLINTDRTLKQIDAHVQRWARYAATGSHGKSAYGFRYEDMKRLGYVSLVNAWYRFRQTGKMEGPEQPGPERD